MPRGGTRVCLAAVLGLAAAAALAAPASASYYGPSSVFNAPDATQSPGDEVCDGGDAAIGGGVDGNGDYDEGVYLNTSRPYLLDGTTPGWTIWVDNYAGGTGTRTPQAYVMCDDNPKPNQYTIRTHQISVADNTQDEAFAPCQAGETVVGGGGRSSGFYADETYLATSAPYDGQDGDKVPDDGWRAVLNNDEGGAASNTLDVFAICDSKHNKRFFEYVRKTRKVPDGTQKTRVASCGKRKRAGGGVESHSAYKHGLYINSSFPNTLGSGERLWIGTVDNYDTPDDKARKITTTAICKR